MIILNFFLSLIWHHHHRGCCHILRILDWLSLVAPLYDAGLQSGLYVRLDKKKILCDKHDTELGLCLVIITWTMGRSQNSNFYGNTLTSILKGRKHEVEWKWYCNVPFIPQLASWSVSYWPIFSGWKRKKGNVAAKYTTKPLCILSREKRKPAGTTQSKYRSLRERKRMKSHLNLT